MGEVGLGLALLINLEPSLTLYDWVSHVQPTPLLLKSGWIWVGEGMLNNWKWKLSSPMPTGSPMQVL